MTVEEFSREFDILYNNIMSNAAPGIDEYEKSVFLTKAQESVVIAIYDGSFEGSENYREDLGALVTSFVYDSKEHQIPTTTEKLVSTPYSKYNSWFFDFPSDGMFIVYEHIQLKELDICNNIYNTLLVTPITHDEVYKSLQNPFKRPNKKKAFRINSSINSTNAIELLTDNSVRDFQYYIRYIRKPRPIILFNDLEGLTINGSDGILDKDNPCELPLVIQRLILDSAVKLAVETYKQYN